MKRLLSIPILFVLVTACGHKDKGFKPEHLLTEQEMIEVMTDVQIIEADINYQKTQTREHRDSIPAKPVDYAKLSRLYYDQLFEHYGINDSVFMQSMRYYSNQPAVLERIMDSVKQRLTSSVQ